MSSIRVAGGIAVAAGWFVYKRSDRSEIAWRPPDGTVEHIVRWFRILDVAGGLVLGVLRDEMDVENVVVYELVGGR